MKTYFTDIIPKIQRYSNKLDNLTMLTNQHWVIIDELKNSKTVYIFRSNYELLISQNGKVEKGKWEYLGNNSLLIEREKESFLFRHGFFDSNVLALKVDGKNEYAFLINENNYHGDFNSFEEIIIFLESKYLDIINQINTEHISGFEEEKVDLEKSKNEKQLKNLFDSKILTKEEYDKKIKLIQLEKESLLELKKNIIEDNQKGISIYSRIIKTADGKTLLIKSNFNSGLREDDEVFIDGNPAPNGKYKLGWMDYIKVFDGKIV